MKKFLPSLITPDVYKKRLALSPSVNSGSKGFTLIELLVVIAIIAVLSAVGLVMYGTAQKSGRVSRRIQDLKAVQTALELYYNANKTYPVNPPAPLVFGSIPAALVPVYMPAIPVDPSGSTYDYKYASNGTDYKLRAKGAPEMTSLDYATQPNLIDPVNDGGMECFKVDGAAITAWAIYSSNTGASDTPANPNPACWGVVVP